MSIELNTASKLEAMTNLMNPGEDDETKGLLADNYCHLFTNEVTIGPSSQVSDYTAPTFDNYEPLVVAYESPYINEDGKVTVEACNCQWTLTENLGEDSVLIRGYYLAQQNGAPSTISYDFIGGEVFSEPVPLANLGQALTVRPKVSLDLS
jgi:hypothetical protein